MSKALYLPFDTEHGGFDPSVTILSVHFAVCDKDLNVLDELSLLTKPENGLYVVQAGALAVNKIDLVKHDLVATKYNEAGGKIREFLWKHSDNGKTKLVPIGKNVGGDVKIVTENLLSEKTWNQYVSYRHYDITGIVLYLKRKGKLPEDAPESLEKLANYFDIKFEAHTARGDNLAGIEVVKRLEAL